jgi:hypothetical protein
MDFDKLRSLIHHVGQHQLRAGRIGLAVILWRADFEAYRRLGAPITGVTYIKARTPGHHPPPRSLLRAARTGWRWGAIEYELEAGKLSHSNAEWIARQWTAGVPV